MAALNVSTPLIDYLALRVVTNDSRPHTVLTFVFMEQLRRLTQWKMPATEVAVNPAASQRALKAEAR